MLETTTVPETTAQPKGISMLTGEHISEKFAEKRPVAVMYNNIINAIPHSGIDNAGIVYEAPVEGSITRLMALLRIMVSLKRLAQLEAADFIIAISLWNGMQFIAILDSQNML